MAVPDKLETSIGTLNLNYGYPTAETVEKIYDNLVADLFAGRVVPFDRAAAHWYAALLRQRSRIGRPMATADAVIAATALALEATLATRNTTDFEGIDLSLINPWPSA